MRTICLCAALLTLPAAASDLSQRNYIHVEHMTSPELRAAIASGKTTLLLPIGGAEQNGDHIALGKHNARATALAAAIAARLGNALVAPVIAYVPEGAIEPPSGHMRHAGTITIPEAAFEATLDSAARSFLKHGFKTVVLLGDHGGYHKSLRRVADRLNARKPAPVVLVPPEYYREMEHAGIDDTALTLAIEPSMVRDPRGASAEKGRAARDEIVERTAQALRRSLAR